MILIIGGCTLCIGRIFLGKEGLLIITIERSHRLVTNGPYAIIRHPIYARIIFLFLGYALSFSSIIGSIFLISFFFIWFRKRIELEEQLLIQTYGDEYRKYMKKNKRIIPYLY